MGIKIETYGQTNAFEQRIASVLEKVIGEREYEDAIWGMAFDDKNTLNDWAAYAVTYLGKAVSMEATPDEQYRNVLKTATLLMASLEAFDRNGGFVPRHYDPENPNMTKPLDLSRVRSIANGNVTEG
jgi:hypothetical protein